MKNVVSPILFFLVLTGMWQALAAVGALSYGGFVWLFAGGDLPVGKIGRIAIEGWICFCASIGLAFIFEGLTIWQRRRSLFLKPAIMLVFTLSTALVSYTMLFVCRPSSQSIGLIAQFLGDRSDLALSVAFIVVVSLIPTLIVCGGYIVFASRVFNRKLGWIKD